LVNTNPWTDDLKAMIDFKQIKKLIIEPTLKKLNLGSIEFEQLLMHTLEAETNYGCFLKQKEGDCLGVFLMHPNLHSEIWHVFLPNRNDLMTIVSSVFNIYRVPDQNRLIYDLQYATLMAALHYARNESLVRNLSSMTQVKAHYKNFWNKPKRAEILPFVKIQPISWTEPPL